MQILFFLRPVIWLLAVLLVMGGLIWFIPKLRPALKIFTVINPAITSLDSFRGRANILLLGIAGGSHDGADLTDSIMLVSVNTTTSDTVLLSLPRDIWVESLMAKLNTAYHYGESRESGGGLVLAKAAVSEVINQPVHYAVLLDFSGFAKAIDAIGGVTVNIPRGFIDEKYPIPGKETAEPESGRYEILRFSSGRQTLDGATALKYVRSRYAQGEEGTDFNRAQRQQRVLLAFRDKVLSSAVLLHPGKIKALLRELKTTIKTDLPARTYPDLVKLALRINQAGLRTGVLDEGSRREDIPPLLYNPPSNLYGQWVLLPVNNNWQAVYDHVAEILYQNR